MNPFERKRIIDAGAPSPMRAPSTRGTRAPSRTIPRATMGAPLQMGAPKTTAPAKMTSAPKMASAPKTKQTMSADARQKFLDDYFKRKEINMDPLSPERNPFGYELSPEEVKAGKKALQNIYVKRGLLI